ncbi:AAA family ATPase [Stetteria hydrogenophila]
MKRYAVIVTGVPGTGKSSVSRCLAEELGCVHLDVSTLIYRAGLVERDPSLRDTHIASEAGVEYVASRALGVINRGGCVVLDTHYPGEFVSRLEEHYALIVVLRTEPLTLMRRLESRGWRRDKVVENVLAEIFGVIYDHLGEGVYSSVEVDTTSTEPCAAAGEALELARKWRVGPRIDWLSLDYVVELAGRLSAELDLYKGRLGV